MVLNELINPENFALQINIDWNQITQKNSRFSNIQSVFGHACGLTNTGREKRIIPNFFHFLFSE